MSNLYVEPTDESIGALLEKVFGEGIGTSDDSSADFDGRYVATYLDDEDKLVAVCACDLPFVVYSGAALSMIPATVANEMLSEESISDVVDANFHEVMNICSSLMMSDHSAHLRLAKILKAGSDSEAVLGELADNGTKIGVSLDIPNYGQGKIAFVVT